MKILAISCSHGKLPSGLKQFIKKNSIDMIISLGDHCDGDEPRKIQFANWNFFKGKEYFLAFKEFLKDKYEPVFKHYALTGKATLEELDSFGIPVLVLHGNNDFRNIDREKSGLDLPTFEDVIEESENLMIFDEQKYEISGFRLVGIGGYRDFPRSRAPESHEAEKIEKERETLKKKLEKLLTGWKPNKIILVGHDQPRDTDHDKVNYPSSPAHGKSVGDDAIREVIDKYEPLWYIGGHMHEHHGISKIGKTTIIAVGHGRDGQCVVFELPSLKIEKVTL